MMHLPLPALDDVDGERLPEALPPVVDAHVHLFPDRVFEAVWRWFDEHGWPIRHKLHTPRVVDFLLSRGVSRLVALCYAHKPGMAAVLNRYMAEIQAREPRVVALGTVLPGEEGAASVLAEAFALGLHGVKLHCHVQAFAPDADAARAVYAACEAADKPVIVHAGRAPASPAYKCDVHALCSAAAVERVLRDHPNLRLCVPHLGADELDEYERLVTRYDNLWLDTTMMMAGYFPGIEPERLLHARPERVMYGTDFPNVPYAWDREIKRIAGLGLREEQLAMLLGGTAIAFYGGATQLPGGSRR
jgi:predicted TIM-barrel fold metal-dependent hydrolase